MWQNTGTAALFFRPTRGLWLQRTCQTWQEQWVHGDYCLNYMNIRTVFISAGLSFAWRAVLLVGHYVVHNHMFVHAHRQRCACAGCNRIEIWVNPIIFFSCHLVRFWNLLIFCAWKWISPMCACFLLSVWTPSSVQVSTVERRLWSFFGTHQSSFMSSQIHHICLNAIVIPVLHCMLIVQCWFYSVHIHLLHTASLVCVLWSLLFCSFWGFFHL